MGGIKLVAIIILLCIIGGIFGQNVTLEDENIVIFNNTEIQNNLQINNNVIIIAGSVIFNSNYIITVVNSTIEINYYPFDFMEDNWSIVNSTIHFNYTKTGNSPTDLAMYTMTTSMVSVMTNPTITISPFNYLTLIPGFNFINNNNNNNNNINGLTIKIMGSASLAIGTNQRDNINLFNSSIELLDQYSSLELFGQLTMSNQSLIWNQGTISVGLGGNLYIPTYTDCYIDGDGTGRIQIFKNGKLTTGTLFNNTYVNTSMIYFTNGIIAGYGGVIYGDLILSNGTIGESSFMPLNLTINGSLHLLKNSNILLFIKSKLIHSVLNITETISIGSSNIKIMVMSADNKVVWNDQVTIPVIQFKRVNKWDASISIVDVVDANGSVEDNGIPVECEFDTDHSTSTFSVTFRNDDYNCKGGSKNGGVGTGSVIALVLGSLAIIGAIVGFTYTPIKRRLGCGWYKSHHHPSISKSDSQISLQSIINLIKPKSTSNSNNNNNSIITNDSNSNSSYSSNGSIEI